MFFGGTWQVADSHQGRQPRIAVYVAQTHLPRMTSTLISHNPKFTSLPECSRVLPIHSPHVLTACLVCQVFYRRCSGSIPIIISELICSRKMAVEGQVELGKMAQEQKSYLLPSAQKGLPWNLESIPSTHTPNSLSPGRTPYASRGQ